MTIERPDWGPGTALVPSTATDTNQEAAGETISPAADDVSDDSALHRKLLADGIFTPEELARYYGLTEAEMDALSGAPRPGMRQAIAAEIAAIEKRMREDRRAYFKDEKAQARYLELLRLREQLKAGPEPTDDITGEQDDAPGPALDPALLEEWENAGGVEYHLQTAQRTAQAALDALEEEDRASLLEGFDGLPAGVQTQVYRFLAVEGGAWPTVNDAALERAAGSAVGAELIPEWGRQAARNVGVVNGRISLMLQSMTPEDRSTALAWLDALPPSQAKAVLKALAGG